MSDKYIGGLLITIILLLLFSIGQGYAALPQPYDFEGTSLPICPTSTSDPVTTIDYINNPSVNCEFEPDADIVDQFTLPQNGQKENMFRVVVIGDSIAWGAGLDRDKKY